MEAALSPWFTTTSCGRGFAGISLQFSHSAESSFAACISGAPPDFATTDNEVAAASGFAPHRGNQRGLDS